MRRIFKFERFAQRASRERISDEDLVGVVGQLDAGSYDAKIGTVFKVRLARKGQGKSHGYRLYVVHQPESNVFFLTLLSKSDRSNLTKAEEDAVREVAKLYQKLDGAALAKAVGSGAIVEIPVRPSNPSSDTSSQGPT